MSFFTPGKMTLLQENEITQRICQQMDENSVPERTWYYSVVGLTEDIRKFISGL